MWGKHLVVDMRGSEHSTALVSDKNNIVSFTKKLVGEIGMVAYGEPSIEHFAQNNSKAAGYTLVQLIETSSIVGHFVDANGDAYIDIFSCRTFSTTAALKVINNYFKPANLKTTILNRQA